MTSTHKTIGRMMIFGTAVAGLTSARFAFGGYVMTEPGGATQATVEDTKAPIGAAGSPTTKDQKLPSSNPRDASPVLAPWRQRYIANVKKLREMIEEKLESSSAQKEKIGGLFDDFIAEIKKNPSMRQFVPNQPPNKINPQDLRVMEEKMRQAQQTGDNAAVEKLRENINVLKKEPPASSGDRTYLWIEKIRAELKPDQGEAFQKTVESWEAIAARIPLVGPYMSLRRALRNLELGLSKEDLAALDLIMDNTMWAILSNTQSVTNESLAEIAVKAQIAVNEKLTPEQQAKVEADVKMFDAEKKRAHDSIYSGRDTIGNAGNNVETGNWRGSTEQKKP